MKLIIGNKNYSSWSLRAWLVLKQFGIAFDEEVIPLDLADSQERLRKVSPTARVPVLVDAGTVVPETIAIIEYLHDKYPAKGIWPSDRLKRAAARAVSAEMHAGFGTLRELAPMNLRARFPGVFPAERVAADIRRIEIIWGDLTDESGGPFLFGKFTAADAMFAPVATRIRTYGLPVSDAAASYVDTIYALPAFQEWLAAAQKEAWVIADTEMDAVAARLGAR